VWFFCFCLDNGGPHCIFRVYEAYRARSTFLFRILSHCAKEDAGEMVIRINKEFCKGCGFCIEFCPKNVFELSDELNSKGYQLPRVARLGDCSECGQCDLYCPEFAVVLEETA